MATLSSIVLLLSLFLFSFIIHGVEHTQNNPLIENTCKTCAKTDPNINYTFCTTSFQTAAPASQCSTLRDLGTVSINLIFNNVTDTRGYIKRLMKRRKLNRYVRECLGDCFEMYSDAIPDLREAMKSYSSRQYEDANVKISAVMDAATTCEDGFKERGGAAVSPLTARNDNVFQLCAMALSVMHQIQTGPPTN